MKVLFLELGAGMNTPTIIKFSFWRMVNEWKTLLMPVSIWVKPTHREKFKRIQFVSTKILEMF